MNEISTFIKEIPKRFFTSSVSTKRDGQLESCESSFI